MLRSCLTLSVLLGFILSAPLASQEDTGKLEAKKKMTSTVGLKDPKKAKETAPDKFQVKFTTTQGDITFEVTRAWAPNGADRFYSLVKAGYFDDVVFFRVISGFMAQFGIHGDPEVNKVWRAAKIQDDPVKQSNSRGMVTFATSGPNCRTTQLFISFVDNKFLDSQGFSPFAKVIAGMDVVDKLHAGYGEGAPKGQGPDQGRIQSEGNPYLESDFPKLDRIKTARLIEAGS